jgi:hypothetical protein
MHRFQWGLATCTWRIPKWAHRQRIAGTIRVRAGGAKTARWFARRIR